VTATLYAIGGALAGVILGGLLDRGRERWRWRMDARRQAYSALVRAASRFVDLATEYFWSCKDHQSYSRDESAEIMWDLEDLIAELHGLVVDVELVGSRAMAQLAEKLDSIVWTMERVLRDEDEVIVETWGEMPRSARGDPVDVLEVLIDEARWELARRPIQRRKGLGHVGGISHNEMLAMRRRLTESSRLTPPAAERDRLPPA
jgi:hypothetical protein